MSETTKYSRVDGGDNSIRPSPNPIQYTDGFPSPPVQHSSSFPASNISYNSTSQLMGPARHGSGDYDLSGSHNESDHPTSYTEYKQALQRPPHPIRTRSGSSFLSTAWQSTRDFAVSHFNVPKLAAPWEHELDEKVLNEAPPAYKTVREFDYRRQRRRLFINSSFQLFVTAALCGILAGALYGFSTIIDGLSQPQKRGFNALITGLSIILGENIGSSLAGYAQMMRWRFLASGYRTLQDFELVMNCDSMSKVFRLLWAGRTRGRFFPNKTQTIAFIWITIYLGLQVAAALLGLTYSIDVSEEYLHMVPGNLSVADLTSIYTYNDGDESSSSFNAQAAVANQYGITGQNFQVINTTIDVYAGTDMAYYRNNEDTSYWYRFVDRSPTKFSTNAVSYRTVTTQASCQSYEVTFGGYAGFDFPDGNSGILYFDPDRNETRYFYVPLAATGATTWIASTNLTDCGPRCTMMWALQSADNYTVTVPMFWQCNSTVDHVANWEEYGDQEVFDFTDQQARILAGSLAWSGISTHLTGFDDSLQYMRYSPSSVFSPNSDITTAEMETKIMRFSASAIAAIDLLGFRREISDQFTPTSAQVVVVQWQWAAIVLCVIPFVQATILLLVIGFANKAIIKDTSHLSTARLLRPLVDKLGDRGCLLTGDEICEELGNFKVIYGARTPAGGYVDGGNEVRHLDIIEQTEGIPRWHGRMPPGRYDGLY